jgi:hypothetical protein
LVAIRIEDEKDIFGDLTDRPDADFTVGASVVERLNSGAVEDAAA